MSLLFPKKLKPKKLISLIQLAVIICCWCSSPFAKIVMDIDPLKIQVNDTFRIVLTVDDAQFKSIPDLTPLQKDFTLVSTQQRASYSNINGNAQLMKQWIILLSPNKTGKLEIPPIEIVNEKTAVKFISVASTPLPTKQNASGDSLNDVILKTDLNPSSPFVNQQILYTVKLYNNKQLIDAEYIPPSVDDGLLFKLGDGREFRTQLNGKTYSVLEINYAVFPQKSGRFIVNPPSFQAVVYDMYSHRVSLKGKSEKITVKATPAGVKESSWLPAQKVTLAETYEQASSSMNQGDTFTRVVTLQAIAMPGELLPKLEFNHQDNFNVYPEKESLSNSVMNNELVGSATFKITYLLNKPGEITIPAIEVPWFNTKTRAKEVVRLDGRTIDVKPTTLLQKPKPPAIADAKLTRELPKEESVTANHSLYNNAWWFSIVFAMGWLITIILWIYSRKSHSKYNIERKAILRLKEACAKNRARQATAALMSWARIKWPDAEIFNITDITKFTGDLQFNNQLQRLSNFLYDPMNDKTWQGDMLWKSFLSLRKNKPHKNKSNALPPINPLGNNAN